MCVCFPSIVGGLTVFSFERALFLREVQNKTYGVGSYFWGKGLAEFPFYFVYPPLTIVICYFALGL